MTRIVDECAAIALAGLADDIATRFADDPLGTLRNDLHLTVRAVDHLDDSQADGGVCDGVSYLSDGVVLYRTTGNRRENFTLAHDLGHWLVDQTDDVYDKLADPRCLIVKCPRHPTTSPMRTRKMAGTQSDDCLRSQPHMLTLPIVS